MDEGVHLQDSITLTVPVQYAYIGLLRSLVLGLDPLFHGAPWRPSPEQLQAWGLAVYEAGTNVVRHGYGGGGAASVTLEVALRDDRIEFTLLDYGQPNQTWHSEKAHRPEFGADHGYGQLIISQVMDAVHYESDGQGPNRLVMVAKLGGKTQPA